ncbi:sarcosine oxidase subunit gamma family protein [Streptomyces sp. NPDC090741]|uniref:sarcosine oxidase subunit gamma family protein n=1 Tax=Streptomyces sp. NPDC090741 TaxID=3365967 RepID=UPI0038263422
MADRRAGLATPSPRPRPVGRRRGADPRQRGEIDGGAALPLSRLPAPPPGQSRHDTGPRARHNTLAGGAEFAALWLGPTGTRTHLEARLREAVGDRHAADDVSAQRTTPLIDGVRAAELLAHGCSLDLHPRSFGAWRCGQTTPAPAQVVLVRDEPRPRFGFRVLVRSSFAGYPADWPSTPPPSRSPTDASTTP